MARRTVNLSDEDMELLNILKEHYRAASINETVRRSISQASLLRKFADDDGQVTVMRKDGTPVLVPTGG